MRVFFFFDTFSSTPTAASSNDQIQKFYFFPEERGRPMVYWNNSLLARALQPCLWIALPPPPPNYFSEMHWDKENTDEQMSL